MKWYKVGFNELRNQIGDEPWAKIAKSHFTPDFLHHDLFPILSPIRLRFEM